MKRSAPRVLGIVGAVLLTFSCFPAPAHADDEGARAQVDPGLFARRKVGRSGQVYTWKPDC